jgi:chemotaxis protein MotC
MGPLRRSLFVAALVPGLLAFCGLDASFAENKAHPPSPTPAAPPEPPAPAAEPALDLPQRPDVRQPYDMLRELRQLQDRIAQGDTEALVKQREMTEAMVEAFAKLDDEIWQDPRNGRAVLAFVLSGGDPKALRNLLLRGQPKSIDANLSRAVHAFVSGRRGEALEHFAKLDALSLDPTIAGQVAMAQSELLSRIDAEKALEKLDQARLLAPGTLIEEAALRRQIGLLSTRKDFAAADKYSEIYFRRFPRSAYATTLKRQIVRFTMDRPAADERAPLGGLVAALDRMSPAAQLEMYLEIAREGVNRVRRDIVLFSAGKALALATPDGIYEARAKIYINAMRAASLEAADAKATLETLKPKTENKEDRELIVAAQSIAGEIGAVGTITPSTTPDPQWLKELGETFATVGRGQSLIVNADRLLAEASK